MGTIATVKYHWIRYYGRDRSQRGQLKLCRCLSILDHPTATKSWANSGIGMMITDPTVSKDCCCKEPLVRTHAKDPSDIILSGVSDASSQLGPGDFILAV